MASSDAFTQQIIKLVRSMPDDAILALVKNQLGLDGGALGGRALGGRSLAPAAAPAPKRRSRPAKAAKTAPAAPKAAPAPAAKAAPVRETPAAPKPKAKAPAKKAAPAKAPAKAAPRGRAGRGAGDRSELLNVVERAIKSGNGMAASEVAKAAGIPQSRATAAIKELKLAKRIFQGGDRRFARYAGDARTAQVASENARKTASGPVVKSKKRK